MFGDVVGALLLPQLQALLSGFPTTGPVLWGQGENAGVVDSGRGQRLAFKNREHNTPRRWSRFQGAATGVGGIPARHLTMGATGLALLNSLVLAPSTTPARWP